MMRRSMALLLAGRTAMATRSYSVGITGASGVVGTALRDELSGRSDVTVVPLIRSETVGPKTDGETLTWNPKATEASKVIDPEALASLDAIVHLSGENVAMGRFGFLRPWTDAKKASVLESRVGTTKALALALSQCDKPKTLIVASGVGAYGHTFVGPDAPNVDESADTSQAPGFLAQVSREWEAAVDACREKHRVVHARFGVVLSKRGGALAQWNPVFSMGLGGIVASGQQFLSFISVRDHARALIHLLETPSLEGPVNLTSPKPCTNLELTQALGKVLRRPTLFPMPSFVVSLMFGEMGDEMLAGGTRAVPKKLEESGFVFEHPDIESALSAALKEPKI